MNRISILLALNLACLAACGGPTDEPADEPAAITKDEARTMGGKSDHVDWCEALGWYGDGICDDFCVQPDPDCRPTCASDADCAEGYCESFASCLAIGCPPPPPPQCVTPDCDDGSTLNPLCDMRPVCEGGQVSAIINGCFQCVDARTCEAPEPPSCDDGSSVNPLCDARELCPDGTVSALQNGCFRCVDPVSCEPPAPEPNGQFCGGLIGMQCPDGQYCAYAQGDMCGAADAGGTCQPKPEACITLYDPVCGCDGNTYSNSCFAAAAGISLADDPTWCTN